RGAPCWRWNGASARDRILLCPLPTFLCGPLRAGAPVSASSVMRTKSPSIVPGFDFEVCLVLDDFGRFRVYREADENENERETVIRNIIGGQYERLARVVAFNTAEGWSRDITEDVAREIVERAARTAE